MKSIFTLLLLTSLPLSTTQHTSYTGDYSKMTRTEKDEIFEWHLSLNEDGTFLYHFFRNLNCNSCVEEHFYGKGTWNASKKTIIFHTTVSDIDVDHTINFNNSKARIIKKSSHNKHKEAIRFYVSEVPSIKGLLLYKK